MVSSNLTQRALAAHHERLVRQKAAHLTELERRRAVIDQRAEEARNVTVGYVQQLLGEGLSPAEIDIEWNGDDTPQGARFLLDGCVMRLSFQWLHSADASQFSHLYLLRGNIWLPVNDLAGLGALLERSPSERQVEALS